MTVPSTEPPAPAASDASATAPTPEATRAPRSYAPLFLKGCGWTLLSVTLGVGVFVASKGDISSVGSALAGIVMLLLVLSSSGLTGFWGDKR